MVKPTTKWGKGTTALPPSKSSWNLVDASTGKTTPRTRGAAISKKSPISTHSNMPKSIKTHSSSVKCVAAASEVGSQSGDGEVLAAGQRSCSRKVSKSKVVGQKSLGSTLRFPPPISRKMRGDKVGTTGCTILKPAHFLQQETSTPIHLLGSSGPGDHGKAAPKLVQQKWVQVQSLSPMDSDDSNPDPAASDILLGHHLDETNQSQPTPCNSQKSSPVPEVHHHQDDSVVELEASQDKLDELNRDESTDFSMEMSQDSQVLKHQLYEKHKQVKKAEKQARIQHLQSQLAETDQQLDMLKQKSLAQSTSGKSSSQPAATSTPQTTSHQDQSWLQQAELDAADAFLDQLDDTPARGSGNNNQLTDKSSKPSKKCKLVQPWFMMPNILEVSSDQSSDEPLGESSVTSSSDPNSSEKKSRQHRRSKKHKLKSGMFAKHTSTIRKPQLWPHNHLDPHFVSHMPKFPDISWDQLVAREVAIILQAKSHTQAMGRLCLLKQLAYWKLPSGNLCKVQ